MHDPATLNAQVLEAVAANRRDVVGDYAATEDLAWMAIAQAATTTVQDSAASLRSTNTIAVAAIASALAGLQADGDARHAEVIKLATGAIHAAAEQFKLVATNAIQVLAGHSKGAPDDA